MLIMPDDCPPTLTGQETRKPHHLANHVLPELPQTFPAVPGLACNHSLERGSPMETRKGQRTLPVGGLHKSSFPTVA